MASLSENHQRGLVILESVTRLAEQSFARVDELQLLRRALDLETKFLLKQCLTK